MLRFSAERENHRDAESVVESYNEIVIAQSQSRQANVFRFRVSTRVSHNIRTDSRRDSLYRGARWNAKPASFLGRVEARTTVQERRPVSASLTLGTMTAMYRITSLRSR